MHSILFITFVITSALLIIVPGPNVLVIVSTSIAYGAKRGLQTVLGTSSAMVIQLAVAAIGTTWLVESITKGFVWLRWLGVAYLLYLGIVNLLKLAKNESVNREASASGCYSRGFMVSLTNPKTILFFGAFLPQFVAPGADYMTQIVLLSVTFLVLATVLDSLYAILAGRVSGLLHARHTQKVQAGVSGLLYLGAGAWLAALRKSSG